LPVDVLHLDPKSRQRLSLAGVTTLAELVGTESLSARTREALGSRAESAVGPAVSTLLRHCSQDGVDLDGFWRDRGVVLAPSKVVEPADVGSLLGALPALVRLALRDDVSPLRDPERDWVIVDGRYGLVSQPKTLEDLGSGVLGLTRERVRQLEAKSMGRLQLAWQEGFHGTVYRLNPALEEPLSRLRTLAEEATGPVAEPELFARLALEGRLDARAARGLAFVLGLAGLSRLDSDGDRRPALWARTADQSVRRFVETSDRIARLLTESVVTPLTESDIAVELNRGRRSDRCSLGDIEAALPLLADCVVQMEDGRWRGKFEHLVGRGNQVYRLLETAGEPQDLDQIAKEINARSLGRRVTVRNLSNQIAHDPRLVPIGKSGLWGLADKHAAAAATIVEMMVETLHRAGRPLTAAQILDSVKARRVVSAASVGMYLQMRPEFVGLPDRQWALASWPEAAKVQAERARKTWQSGVTNTPGRRSLLAERMRDVVVPFLEKAPDQQRPLLEVVRLVNDRLGVRPATAYGYVKRIPGLERIDRDGVASLRLTSSPEEPQAPREDPESAGLRELIGAGEMPKVEFKSSLRWDMRQQKDNPALQKMCTKTIAAFSNTQGGMILIGVEPNGSICGIEVDGKTLMKPDDTCVDAFSRALAAVVAEHLGGGVAAQLPTKYVPLDGGTVCLVEVPPSPKPVYLNDGKTTEFYVRSGTTSRALPLSEVADYVRGRWR
jgi:hypothetical protein